MISCSRTQLDVCEIAEIRHRLYADEEKNSGRLIQGEGKVLLNTVIRSVCRDKGPSDAAVRTRVDPVIDSTLCDPMRLLPPGRRHVFASDL
jgi:hypothetical protein